jgi:glycosyltransferase involved in cell wall biosynthesis
MNIIFAGTDMGMGGAELVVSKLANSWTTWHNITIATLLDQSSDFFSLNPSLKRISLNFYPTKWYHIIRLIRVIIKLRIIYTAGNFDYIISFMPKMNIYSLLALLFTGKKLIICEHSIINRPDISKRVNLFRKIFYRYAYKITIPHEEIYRELINTFPSINKKKVIITPNPVDPFPRDASNNFSPSDVFVNYSPDDKILIAAGRFVPNKAHKDTIIAFSLLRKEIKKVKLIICGDGEELNECKTLVEKLGLNDLVSFTGNVRDINKYYAISDIFVTTTQFEGFGLALTEAMSAGIPVIAFDAPYLAVLIHNDYNGYLIKDRDHKEMARKIAALINDDVLYKKLSLNAVDICDKYSMENINAIWMEKVLC